MSQFLIKKGDPEKEEDDDQNEDTKKCDDFNERDVCDDLSEDFQAVQVKSRENTIDSNAIQSSNQVQSSQSVKAKKVQSTKSAHFVSDPQSDTVLQSKSTESSELVKSKCYSDNAVQSSRCLSDLKESKEAQNQTAVDIDKFNDHVDSLHAAIDTAEDATIQGLDETVDIFVHQSVIQGAGWRCLEPGQRVLIRIRLVKSRRPGSAKPCCG